jgi:hypothetical protein
MGFTHAQKTEIFKAGYTVLRDFVPHDAIERARKAINHSMGEGIDPAQLPTLRAQSYCPELKASTVITDLFNATQGPEFAESVLGKGTFEKPAAAQIALRFPRADDDLPPFRPHLDGLPTMTNGVASGTIGSFSALVGVLLSDLPEKNSGNFTVLPGTHRSTAAYFQEHGPKSFLEGFPSIEQPEPVQITGNAGDMVFCHYQVGHGIAPNISSNIRYAVFFRLTHKDHSQDIEGRLIDIWRDWPGMSEFVS